MKLLLASGKSGTIVSAIATGSAAFKANRDGMLALIARMRGLEERTRAASAAAKDRFHKRGQLLPRERVALVLDPGSPFVELSTLAGYMFDVPDADKSVPGGGLVAGIGFVSGIRCMVSANDSGIDAGALQPYGLDKTLRVQELALENKLPYVQLVESAGANLLRYRVEDFVRGGNIFRNLARLSAAGLPVVTVTHGSSTAGGAYQTGLSDYIVMVRGRTRAFLAGPPLLKAATGEIATEEELGGAEMHTSISGLGDYLAEDDRDALRIARDIMANLEWDRLSPAENSFKPPRAHHLDQAAASPALCAVPTDPALWSASDCDVPRPRWPPATRRCGRQKAKPSRRWRACLVGARRAAPCTRCSRPSSTSRPRNAAIACRAF